MSALANILKRKGLRVSGSDTKEKFFTDAILKKCRINFFEGFNENNLKSFNPDLIVYSSAYKEDNPEIKLAKKMNSPLLSYAEVLGLLFKEKFGIAICGSHGKTTTAALVGQILEEGQLDPTVLVGSRVRKWQNNNRFGHSPYLVAEVDEYQNKLRHYNPKIAILTNIDFDHPDFFRTPEEYKQTFFDFIKKLPPDGLLIAWAEDPIIEKHLKKFYQCRVATFGFKKGLWQAKLLKDNYWEFWQNKKKMGVFKLNLIGRHNVLNNLAAFICGYELGVKSPAMRKVLANFKGTTRRLELKGIVNGIKVIDDYAHHPTEIQATLKALKDFYFKKRVFCLFQPHTFTRTEVLFKDFARSFQDVGQTIILDIYGSAREKSGRVSSENLAQTASKYSQVKYLADKNQILDFLRENLKKGDILLTMGAGDVWKLGEEFLELAKK